MCFYTLFFDSHCRLLEACELELQFEEIVNHEFEPAPGEVFSDWFLLVTDRSNK